MSLGWFAAQSVTDIHVKFKWCIFLIMKLRKRVKIFKCKAKLFQVYAFTDATYRSKIQKNKHLHRIQCVVTRALVYSMMNRDNQTDFQDRGLFVVKLTAALPNSLLLE